MATATVDFWHEEEGWGAIRDPDRPGLGFVHFSFIVDMPGFRSLRPGEEIEYEWLGDYPQDGCDWRPAWVRRLQ
jgi:cold shock CspA family protein